MEWGIIVTAVEIVGMFALLVAEANAGTADDTKLIPDYETEYESLAINVADYQYVV